jgi:transposase
MTSAHDALDQAARLQAHRGGRIRHLQRIFAPEESRCLCLFESSGTALMMLAEIGDITRFPSARKLASWAGLTPTVRGSDLKVRHGHISKQGSAWLRWAMNQAAQTAKRSPEFAASYAAITKRRGKKIATIAIARKLVTRAWHLLSEMEPGDAGTPLRRP